MLMATYRLSYATREEFLWISHTEYQDDVEQPAAHISKDGSENNSPRDRTGRVLCFFSKTVEICLLVRARPVFKILTKIKTGGPSYCPVAPLLVMVQAALRKPNRKEKPGS